MTDQKAPTTNDISKIALWLFAMDAPAVYALVKKLPSGDLERSYTRMANASMTLAKDRVARALARAGCDQSTIDKISQDVLA